MGHIKILGVMRKHTTVMVTVVNFKTGEMFSLYFQFSLKHPWWIPRYDPHYGENLDIPLWGWLCFYFGRETNGFLIPKTGIRNSYTNGKRILVYKHRAYRICRAKNREWADIFHFLARYRIPVRVRIKDGNTLEIEFKGELPSRLSRFDFYDYGDHIPKKE